MAKTKIRVCHVAVADLWAGAEVQMKSLVAELARIPEFEVSVILFNKGRLVQELSSLGVPVQVFPEEEWSGLKIARSLWRYFSAGHVDIVHTHKYKDTILAAPVAHWAGVSHVVRSIHGLAEPFVGVQAWKMTFYEVLEQWVQARYVETVIAVSSGIERHLLQELKNGKIVCIHNGIDLKTVHARIERSDLRKALGASAKTCVLGTVGRLTPVKGLPYLMKAVKMLVAEGLDINLWFVGDGVLKEELRVLGKELGIVERIAILGHREDPYDLMQAMDIFIIPSLSEGIPMALLEAMAMSLPVIATRVGGIPEVIEEGISGLLVKAGDPEDLASVCRQLINDKALCDRLGQAAKKRVEQGFSSASMANRVAHLYRELMK